MGAGVPWEFGRVWGLNERSSAVEPEGDALVRRSMAWGLGSAALEPTRMWPSWLSEGHLVLSWEAQGSKGAELVSLRPSVPENRGRTGEPGRKVALLPGGFEVLRGLLSTCADLPTAEFLCV